MGIEKENELSYLCGMIQNGKILYADAMRYLELVKDEYGIEEEQFQKLYKEWVQNGEVCRELNWIRSSGQSKKVSGFYQNVLDGMYRMVEEGEITLEMMAENLWKDVYKVRKDSVEGYIGFYPELPGCIGYGRSREKLRVNMKKALKDWIYAAYIQWREMQIINGKW